MTSNSTKYRVLSGYCPDEACRTQLFFPIYDLSIECANCGQRHQQSSLKNVAEVTNPNIALEKILRNILFGNKKPKKGPESVKVLGFSNYECKILSPLLSRYGMDKATGKAKLLSEMGQGEIFDCGVLGDRAFLIEPEQMEVSGYGRDHTGSVSYLKETLEAIRKSNNNEECLLPIHADGDGHCLVHAVSRALIGRELFWHALRANLKEHFQKSLDKYKLIFSDFVDSSEWVDIIEECDTDFVPRDGEPMGLRNIHIFGLANILKRPIILLDSITGIQSSGDYTGIFLPGLLEPDQCRGKDGQRNKPLCLAWSSNGHNHYIALVGVKGRTLPRLPGWMMPKSWGMPQPLVTKYIDLDQDQGCTIGGSKCLGDRYILRLVNAMEEVFREKHGVSASLVADVNQYIFKSTGLVSVAPEVVTHETAVSVRENRLYRCFTCSALSQHNILPEWFQPDGRLYRLAVKSHGQLDAKKQYSFPVDGVVCSYDEEHDCLVPDMSRTRLNQCTWCMENKLRLVRADGSIVYINGDRTQTPTQTSKCNCGYKHYWNGAEYDNLPLVFPVKLEWGGKVVTETVEWFQDESDPALNSNVFELAQKLVQKNFPGEFGSERLVQKVVSRILDQTAVVAKDEAKPEEPAAAQDKENEARGAEAAAWDDMSASKIILTGQAKKTLHKEELTKSNAEKDLKQRIESKAGQVQRRRTMEEAQHPVTVRSPTKVSPKQQKTTPSPQHSQSVPSGVPLSASHRPTSAPAVSSPRPEEPAGVSARLTHSPVPVETSAGAGVKQSVRRIRVTTSDGRQTQLTLEPGTTYSKLQELLADNLQVPVNRQRIKAGFPPRELLPPAEGEPDVPLPLQHGDRVTLEVLPDTTLSAGAAIESAPGQPVTTTDRLLQSLTSLQTATDDIDTTITSLTLMADLTGSDLWSHVQAMPNLFERGGAFFEQVNRDLTLAPNKHCTLPSLPGKVFRYNATEDILELCLEPQGHFRVEPGIEDKVLGRKGASAAATSSFSDLSQLGLGSQASVQAALKSGSQGVQVDPKMNYSALRPVAFSGRGQTMASSSSGSATSRSMTGTPAIHPLARTSRGVHMSEQAASVQHVVPMETDQQPEPTTGTETKKDDPLFKRVGPGYRVLEPKAQNATNTSIAKLMSVAQVLETASDMNSPTDGTGATASTSTSSEHSHQEMEIEQSVEDQQRSQNERESKAQVTDSDMDRGEETDSGSKDNGASLITDTKPDT